MQARGLRNRPSPMGKAVALIGMADADHGSAHDK